MDKVDATTTGKDCVVVGDIKKPTYFAGVIKKPTYVASDLR
jgi:hypothetical protein